MTTAITGTKTELLALAAKVDQEMGYPKPGEPIGGGTHAPPEECVTLRYTNLREHPTEKGTWAYPLDETSRPVVAEKQVEEGKITDSKTATLAGEVVLGTDWKEPDPVVVKGEPTSVKG